jgi:hypothetical protein
MRQALLTGLADADNIVRIASEPNVIAVTQRRSCSLAVQELATLLDAAERHGSRRAALRDTALPSVILVTGARRPEIASLIDGDVVTYGSRKIRSAKLSQSRVVRLPA